MAERLTARSWPLTARQAEVLVLVANGNTAVEIAGWLWVSPNTVNRVLQNAYRNLGVSSGAQAVAVALRLGLIPVEAVRLPEAVSRPLEPPDVSGGVRLGRSRPEKGPVRPPDGRTRLARPVARPGL